MTSSGNQERIGEMASTLKMKDLEKSEVEEIDRIGKTVHYRFYSEHMEVDFPVPNLPTE